MWRFLHLAKANITGDINQMAHTMTDILVRAAKDLMCPMVEQCRYLGTIISIKNSDIDLKRQVRKMYANANLLF